MPPWFSKPPYITVWIRSELIGTKCPLPIPSSGFNLPLSSQGLWQVEMLSYLPTNRILVVLASLALISSTSFSIEPDDAHARTQPFGQDSPAQLASNGPSPVVPGEILVMFKPRTDQSHIASTIEEYGGIVLSVTSSLNVYRIKVPEEQVEKALEGYRSSPFVRAVQRDFVSQPQ